MLRHHRLTFTCLLAACGLAVPLGCGQDREADRTFSTSGNREADQRADQRMARDQQLRGGDPGSEQNAGPHATTQANVKTLYERLGGEQGLTAIANDFVDRVIQDPRVNWERKGLQQGGFSIHRNRSIEWAATEENKAKLKKHLVQFLALATGAPTNTVTYEGDEMKQVHEGLHITNIEFDASVGDLKQSMDNLHIATQEQKELLQIVESTREQVVTER